MSMTTPDDDVVARGRAIFDRLRQGPTTGSGNESESPESLAEERTDAPDTPEPPAPTDGGASEGAPRDGEPKRNPGAPPLTTDVGIAGREGPAATDPAPAPTATERTSGPGIDADGTAMEPAPAATAGEPTAAADRDPTGPAGPAATASDPAPPPSPAPSPPAPPPTAADPGPPPTAADPGPPPTAADPAPPPTAADPSPPAAGPPAPPPPTAATGSGVDVPAPPPAPARTPGPVPLGMPADLASLMTTEPGPVSPADLSPTRFARPLPRVIAIANQKGGVGKTTTAVNIAAGFAELGYRALVVDLDPQGNATTGLGINPRNLESSVYDVMMHDVAMDDCIEPTTLRNLFVCPATIDLAGAEIELVPAFSREMKLRRALEPVLEDFDFVVIDCPPSLGLITVNALAAASEVVVPIQCEYYALEGLGQLLRNVNLVQTNLNPRLEVSAIVLTMFDARTKLAEQVAQEVRTHFGAKVCRNIVPRTVRLSEAPSFGQPILVFDPTSRGAIAYRELAKEVSGGAPQRVG